MKTKAKYKRKPQADQSLVNNWWNWEDRESNHDLSGHQATLLGSDIPFSQMDEIQGVEG